MNTDAMFNAVMELDLEPIKSKLMHMESGEGWSLEQANAVEKEYRRFLCLMKMYPNEELGPLMDVDTFWHYHILDTMKYAVDCDKVFGYFQHHYPYVGMGDEADQQMRIDGAVRMRDLYEATFDDDYPALIEEVAQAGAFSAGPSHDKVNAHADGATIAFSAGPGHDKVKAYAGSAAIAFSAGPGHDKLKAHAGSAAIAFSAGPGHDKLKAHAGNAAIAFSAGPGHDKVRAYAGSAAIAFSAGPGHDKVKAYAGGAAIAFSAGPGHDKLKAHAGNAAIAFSAGPGHDKVKAATAGLTTSA